MVILQHSLLTSHRIKMLRFIIVRTLVVFTLFVSLANGQTDESISHLHQIIEPTISEFVQLTEKQKATIQPLVIQLVQLQSLGDNSKSDEIDQIKQQITGELLDIQKKRFLALRGGRPIKFQFRETQWMEVLHWFSQQADRSLVANAVPKTPFTYSDSKAYTPIEAVDLLNSVLINHGFTLIQKERLLICADLSQGVPDDLIPEAKLEDLDKFGTHEFVRVAFELGGKPAAAVSEEIKPLLGTYGSQVSLPQTKRMIVATTAAKMRVVSATIDSIPVPVPPPVKPKPGPPPVPELVVYHFDQIDGGSAERTIKQIVGDVKLSVDPQAKQISVFTIPSQHAIIDDVLKRMEANAKSAEKPFLEMYPFSGELSALAQSQLKLAAPNATINSDPDNERLVVFGSSEDHKNVVQTISKFDEVKVARDGQTTEVIPLENAKAAEVVESLSQLFPKVKIYADSTGNQIVVKATADENRQINAILEKLDRKRPQNQSMRFHELKHVLTPEQLAVLTTLAPNATVTVQNEGRRLMVVGTSDSHLAVTEVLPRLEALHDEKKDVVLQAHAATTAEQNRFRRLYQQMDESLRDIEIVDSSDPTQLAIMATNEQHEAINNVLTEIRLKLGSPVTELRNYAVTEKQRQQFTSTKDFLSAELKNIKIVDSTIPNRMSVIATVEEHAKIEQILSTLTKAFPTESPQQLKRYAVSSRQRDQFMSARDSLVPELKEIKILQSNDPDTMIVVATENEHAKLQQVLTTLAETLSVDEPGEIKTYPVTPRQLDQFNAAKETLAPELRRIKILASSSADKLVVIATQEEHEKLATLLATISETFPEDAPRQLKSYAVTATQREQFIASKDVLTPNLKRITVVNSSDPEKLIVVANATEHQAVQEVLLNIKLTLPETPEPELKLYPVPAKIRDRFTAILPTLQEKLKNAKLVDNTQNNELVIWATPVEHGEIQKLIEQLKNESATPDRQLAAYPIKKADPASIHTVLTEVYPDAKIIVDEKTQQLLVWTSKDEHQIIRFTIEQMDVDAAVSQQRSMAYYKLKEIDVDDVIPLFRQLVPDVELIGDGRSNSIVAWGNEKEHALLTEAVERLRKQQNGDARSVTVYSSEHRDPNDLRRLLEDIVPNAAIVADRDSKMVAAWATDEDHVAISDAMEKLTKDNGTKGQLVVYSTPTTDADLVIDVLREAIPDGQFADAARDTKVLAWANAEEHKTIARVIEQIDSNDPLEGNRSAKTYRTSIEKNAQLMELLPTIVPNARLLNASDQRSIIVWATEKDHQAVQTVATSMQADQEDEKSLAGYDVSTEESSSLQSFLQDRYPKASINFNSSTKKMIVWGTADNHARIPETIKTWRESVGEPPLVEMRVYPLGENPPSTIVSSLPTAVTNGASIIQEPDRKALIVHATAEKHTELKAAIDELLGKLPELEKRTTEIYSLKKADPATVRISLLRLVPNASISYDTNTNSLLVTAKRDEHRQIDLVVKQIDVEKQSTALTQIYRFKVANPESLRTSLIQLVPSATIAIDANTSSLVVTAEAEEHAKIKDVVAKLDIEPDTLSPTKVYPFRFGNPSAAASSLSQLLPTATFVVDSSTSSLIVTATNSQHEKIQELVANIDKAKDSTAVAKTYPFKVGDPYAARIALRQLFPNATIAVDENTSSLLVTAEPGEHEKINQFVTDIDKRKDSTIVSKAYRFKAGDPNAARITLRQLYPNATLVVDEKTSSLLVTAEPDEQIKISEMVAELDVEQTTLAATKVYPFQVANPNTAANSLSQMLPSATFVVDQETSSLIATATPRQHTQIQEVVTQIDKEQATQLTAKVYKFQSGDPNAARAALIQLLPKATISVDNNTSSLVVTASKKDHEVLDQIIGEIDSEKTTRNETQVFQLDHADPRVAEGALRALLPGVSISADQSTGSLIATATKEQLATINTAITQLDRANPREQLSAYVLRNSDANSVFQSLNQMFGRTPGLRLSLDLPNNTIFAQATASDQKTIATMVARLESTNARDDRSLDTYAVGDTDAQQLLTGIQALFKNSNDKPELTVDKFSNQVFAVATNDQHAQIKLALERIKPERTSLEVFQLTSIDPFTVEIAIDELFRESINGPVVSSDVDTQKLIVRGNKEQIDTVRDLLAKMGEFSLSNESSGRTRVIPFRGGNIDSAIEQLQRVWPQLRKNRIEVLRPDDANALKKELQLENDEDTEVDSNDEAGAVCGDEGLSEEDESDAVASESQDEAAPLIIIPGTESISISSDDSEALSQAETLLRTLSSRSSRSEAGNFAVYQLRNAGAQQLARLLTKLFDQMVKSSDSDLSSSLRSSLGRVSLVADERLNAIIVHGRPADRNVLVELLEVLDSKNLDDSLANSRPQIVRVKNTEAARIHEMLQSVYQTQLSSGGSQTEVEIPEGVDPEVASVLRQINAATAGPLLTLEVDRVTNSIVILAPKQLASQVSELVKKLDEDAKTSDSRAIKIIRLEGTNVRNIEDSLQDLLRR